jgi:undecaprenol kinase
MDLSDKKQAPGKNRRYIDSFRYAFKGVQTVFQEERNMRTHVAAGIAVFLLALFLPMSRMDWLWLFLSSFLVIVMEIWNTTIENLVDLVTEEYHPLAKKVKDMAASAVLISTAFAVVTGIIILLPKLIELFFN